MRASVERPGGEDDPKKTRVIERAGKLAVNWASARVSRLRLAYISSVFFNCQINYVTFYSTRNATKKGDTRSFFFFFFPGDISPFFNKEMKTPLPLGSPSPQKKKDQKKDQISSKIKQKITLAPFFFQFCDVNNLENFPLKK